MRSRLAGVWATTTTLPVVSGSGSWVTTADGERYLDFTSGIAVTSTGHCHPKWSWPPSNGKRERFIHAQVNVYKHDLLDPLAGGSLDSRRRASTRSSSPIRAPRATEAAVKLAKQATGRSKSWCSRAASTVAPIWRWR